jgi:RNA polymerase sigma-70 factor (ECF subfamily)
MLHAEAWRPAVTRTPLTSVGQRTPDSFERLFLEEYQKVVAIAYRVLGDRAAAEDVAQEVFLQFHRSQSPSSEHASGWLHSAAVHSALNVIRGERRRLKRDTTHASEETAARIDNPEQLVVAAERQREVRQALSRLPVKAAAILVLRYSGLSYAEVATALRLKVGNVGTMLRRAEDALRKEVNRATFE